MYHHINDTEYTEYINGLTTDQRRLFIEIYKEHDTSTETQSWLGGQMRNSEYNNHPRLDVNGLDAFSQDWLDDGMDPVFDVTDPSTGYFNWTDYEFAISSKNPYSEYNNVFFGAVYFRFKHTRLSRLMDFQVKVKYVLKKKTRFSQAA